MITQIDTAKIQSVIDRLSQMSRQGASYDHMGKHGWSNPIRHDTHPFLTWYVGLVKPARVLEIGTAHGESLCTLALGNPEAEFHTIEWLPELAAEARENFAEAGLNVTVHNGDAMQILDGLTGQFDLVFLDANKDGYLEQFLKLQEKGLLKPGSWVLADNVTDRQKECQGFLDHMSEKHYAHVILPTECGLLVAQV